MKKAGILLIVLAISLLAFSINQRDNEHITRPYPFSTFELKRDSLYLTHTVWEFIRVKYDVFGYFRKHDFPINSLSVYADSIIYSPDKKRLIGYVIISRPSEYVEDYKKVKNKDGEMDVILFFNSEYYTADRKHYLGAKYTYIIYALVGIRDSEKSPWKIYWIRIIILPSQDNYWSARKAIRSIFKDGFKDIQITCPNEIPDTLFPRQLEMMEHTTFREERMGFNIDDPGFWSDSCTLWKIGQRAKGLYFFQTWTHQPTADQIIIYPNINYPDSLINLYKK